MVLAGDEVRSLFSRLSRSAHVDWLRRAQRRTRCRRSWQADHLCLAGHRRSLRPCLSGSASRGPSCRRAGCRRRSRSRARWRDRLADAAGDIPAFAEALPRLARPIRRLRRDMGGAARRFVLAERSLDTAAQPLERYPRRSAARYGRDGGPWSSWRKRLRVGVDRWPPAPTSGCATTTPFCPPPRWTACSA